MIGLDDLQPAVSTLQAARTRLDTALVARGIWPLLRIRAAELARDIEDAVVLLLEAHPAAEAAQNEETRRLFELLPVRVPPRESQTWSLNELAEWQAAQPQPTREDWEQAMSLIQGELTSIPYAKVKVAYKALLFYVRAYQDALYRAFLASRGVRPGEKSSMASALKEGKPMAAVLAQGVSDYPNWFWNWYGKRNRAKKGVSVGFTGVGGFGLLFHSVSDEGGVVADLAQTPFSVPDVVAAVLMSAAAADCIAAYVESLGANAGDEGA